MDTVRVLVAVAVAVAMPGRLLQLLDGLCGCQQLRLLIVSHNSQAHAFGAAMCQEQPSRMCMTATGLPKCPIGCESYTEHRVNTYSYVLLR